MDRRVWGIRDADAAGIVEKVKGQMPEYEAWKKWLKAHGAELGVE